MTVKLTRYMRGVGDTMTAHEDGLWVSHAEAAARIADLEKKIERWGQRLPSTAREKYTLLAERVRDGTVTRGEASRAILKLCEDNEKMAYSKVMVCQSLIEQVAAGPTPGQQLAHWVNNVMRQARDMIKGGDK